MVLELGWLVPLAWIFGKGAAGSVGPILPVYVFIGFAVLQIAIWPWIETVLKAGVLGRTFTAAGLAVVAGLAVEVPALLGAAHFSGAILVLNWILLIGISLLTLRVLDQDAEYDAVIGDFRFGVVCLVAILALAFANGHSQNRFGPLVFTGVVLYVLTGVFGLAYAHRFAVDLGSHDDRPGGFQADWAVSVAGLLGGLIIISLLLTQVFAFDIVGAVGQLTSPERAAVATAVATAGASIIGFVGWLVGLLGIHGITPHITLPKPPHTQAPPGQQLLHGKRPHAQQAAAWFVTLMKILGIIGAGILALTILMLGLRVAGGRRRPSLTGERRSRSWTWRKMASWMFRRTRDEIGQMLADFRPQMPHRRRHQSVRDVYRSLLAFGHHEGRARLVGETGLEYGTELSAKWPQASAGLDQLNTLYMAERYGAQAPTPTTVARARTNLAAIEAAARKAQQESADD
jgi:hypothetical protein